VGEGDEGNLFLLSVGQLEGRWILFDLHRLGEARERKKINNKAAAC
jgi:hypothetical protein